MYIFLFTTFGTGISQELHFKSKLAIYLECVHFFRKFAFFFSFGGGEWGLEPFLTFQTLLWGHKNISVEDLRHMLLVAWSPFGTSRGIWWSSSSQMLLCCHHQEHLPKLLISAELFWLAWQTVGPPPPCRNGRLSMVRRKPNSRFNVKSYHHPSLATPAAVWSRHNIAATAAWASTHPRICDFQLPAASQCTSPPTFA